MKALEFMTSLNPDDTLTVPPAMAEQLRTRALPLRVLLLLAESDDAASWERLTTEQFLAGYSDSDAIYDSLPTG